MVKGVLVPSDPYVPIQVLELRGLEDYQSAVHGWIEPLEIPQLGVTAYLNEGARREDRDLNLRATLLWWFFTPTWRLKSMIVGDVVLAGQLDSDFGNGAVPDDVLERLTTDASYTVQIRPIGGAIWFGTRPTYQRYFDALLWGMLLGERFAGTDEVRVVKVPWFASD